MGDGVQGSEQTIEQSEAGPGELIITMENNANEGEETKSATLLNGNCDLFLKILLILFENILCSR